MTNNIISPMSISFSSIHSDLKNMIQLNPDTFKDFFNDGAGATVVNVASALGAMYAYQILSQRRELTLSEAKNYSSILGKASSDGYSMYRGENVKLTLNVTPDYYAVYPKWTKIGVYEDYDLTLLDDVTFNIGTPVDIKVVLGNRGVEQKLVESSDITVFRLTSDGVTEDCRLFLNSTEVPTSSNIKTLLEDNYVLVSNAYGSVDIFYLQQGNYKYTESDTITLDFIERNNKTFKDLSQESIYLSDENGSGNITCNSMTLLQERQSVESSSSAKTNILLHNEISGVVRARADFVKQIPQVNLDIISAKDTDVTPGIISVSLLKKDFSLLTKEDKERIIKSLSQYLACGVATLIFENPRKHVLPLNIKVTTVQGASNIDSLYNTVESLVNSYNYVLGQSLNLKSMENAIESSSDSIEIARANIETSAWVAGKSYRVGDSCISTVFNNKAYLVSDIINRTGSTAPEWNPSEITVDNRILWKLWTGDPQGVIAWSANKEVKQGTLITDTADINRKVYSCVGYANYTSDTEPTWGADVVIDGEIVWGLSTYSRDTKEHATSTYFLIGDKIKVIVSDEEYYYDVIDYAAYSDSDSEPDWSGLIEGKITDGERLVWSETEYPVSKIDLPYNTYFEIVPSVTIV